MSSALRARESIAAISQRPRQAGLVGDRRDRVDLTGGLRTQLGAERAQSGMRAGLTRLCLLAFRLICDHNAEGQSVPHFDHVDDAIADLPKELEQLGDLRLPAIIGFTGLLIRTG